MEYIYINGTVDLTKIPKTCKTCKTWTPGADICELNTMHQMECVTSLKRIHWTPNPFALMKLISRQQRPINLIPLHLVYCDTDNMIVLASNHKYLIEAANNRESGCYPYMREANNTVECVQCVHCTFYKKETPWANYCAICGRKLK